MILLENQGLQFDVKLIEAAYNILRGMKVYVRERAYAPGMDPIEPIGLHHAKLVADHWARPHLNQATSVDKIRCKHYNIV